MKTHDQTEITCSIKKLKGLHSDRYKSRIVAVGK
jgi:hypothetical protein